MTALLIALAFSCGAGSGVLLAKVKRRTQINIVNGMLMPNTNDERWKRFRCTRSCAGFRIGEVAACEDHGLYVGPMFVDGGDKYADAVLDAQIERRALAAALGPTEAP